MECNSRYRRFPTGQPGPCIDGYLNTNVIQIGASSEAITITGCTSHSDTILAVSLTPTTKYFSTILTPGNYVIEISATFSSAVTKGYTYYHSFKYNLLTGTWQIINSAKKEIYNTATSAASYKLVHLKSDIITLTETKTLGYFHGVKLVDPLESGLDTKIFNINMTIFKF